MKDKLHSLTLIDRTSEGRGAERQLAQGALGGDSVPPSALETTGNVSAHTNSAMASSGFLTALSPFLEDRRNEAGVTLIVSPRPSKEASRFAQILTVENDPHGALRYCDEQTRLLSSKDVKAHLDWSCRYALVLRTIYDFRAALRTHALASPLAAQITDDPFAVGCHHAGKALSHIELNEFEDGFTENERARELFVECGAEPNVASSDNNMALLMLRYDAPNEALRYAEAAIARWAKLGLYGMVAQGVDTKAQALLGLGDRAGALRAVTESIVALEGLGDRGALQKSLATLARITKEIEKG